MYYPLMLASAFGLGAAHALEPGHGKTIVAAYLVGSRGRTLDAIILGAVVTLTHTVAIYVLTAVLIIAAAHIVPEQVQRWFGVSAGVLVMAVGGWMIYVRTKHRVPSHSHTHGGYCHDHDEHGSAPESGAVNPDSRSGVGLGSLIALGVSGGIVPCPAALLLIPAAVGLGAVAKGLALVVSFSLGLAVVLMAIGILTLKAAGFASRWLNRGDWGRRVSIASAYVITLLGLALTVKALVAYPQAH